MYQTTKNVYKSTLKRCKRFAKEQYYGTQSNKLKNNTKKVWQLINKIVHKKSNKQMVIESLSVADLKIESSTQIAEEFGKYFSQIGKTFADNIEKSMKPSMEYTEKINHNEKTLYLHPTNNGEIKKLIDSLPNKTSSGHDNISNVMLKKIKDSISQPLASLFNESMQDGQVPDIMKIADVIPLHNSKSRNETNITGQYPC